MAPRPRILVADDHPIVLEGIRKALAQLPARVEVALQPEEAIHRLENDMFDLAVLDISFRDSKLTGFDILRSARRDHPHPPVLMASVYDDQALQDTACREGARGFVSRSKPESVWREAATAVLRGVTWFLPPAQPKPRARALTPAELEVAHLLGSGLTEKEAAREMSIHPRTVEEHVREAKERMSARNGIQLMRDFILRGLHLLPRAERRPPPEQQEPLNGGISSRARRP